MCNHWLPIATYIHFISAVHSCGGLCIADEVQFGHARIGSHQYAFQEYGMLHNCVCVGICVCMCVGMCVCVCVCDSAFREYP